MRPLTSIGSNDPLGGDLEPLIRRVYAYVAYRIGDGPNAEDVVAETFERAVRYAGSYDRSRGAPAAWLIGISRRVLAESATGAEPPVEAPERAAPLDLEDDAVRRLSVARAVQALPARERELVALRYGADLTARQIGELLEMRTNAVEVALHRALRRLRGELREDFAPELGASVIGAAPS